MELAEALTTVVVPTVSRLDLVGGEKILKPEFNLSRFFCPANKHKINSDNISVSDRKKRKMVAGAGIQPRA